MYVIGINPSTANEEKPDRTIGRVMGFAEENGFDGFAMINLYPQETGAGRRFPRKECFVPRLGIICSHGGNK